MRWGEKCCHKIKRVLESVESKKLNKPVTEYRRDGQQGVDSWTKRL